MTSVKKVIEVCDRCAYSNAQLATSTRHFSVEDEHYILKLCEPHAVMFDREMIGWSRLAAEDESRAGVRVIRSQSYLSAEQKERERRASELRAGQQRHDQELRAHVDELEQRRKDQADALAAAPRLNVPEPGEDWLLTSHATERAQLRGFDLSEVKAAAENPERVYPSPAKYGAGCEMHKRGECAVAVVPAAKLIITVMPRDGSAESWSTTQPSEKQRIAQ